MSQYGYIDHALANYFAIGVGLSEDEGVSSLRQHLTASRDLRAGLCADLQAALQDPAFSWSAALADNDVVLIQNESEAKAYARKLLESGGGDFS